MKASQYRYFEPPFAAMAHRGGALMSDNLSRENTLYAFSNAVDLGFRYIETDVHASADGVLVAFHDDSLDRVTGEGAKIADTPYEQLKTHLVGGAEPIPTLAQVFEAFPDTFINIDIKAANAIRPLAEVIAKHNAYERVCIGSFSRNRLRTFAKLVGRPVAMAASPLAVGVAAVSPGLLSLAKFDAPVWQIPMTQEVAGKHLKLLTSGLLTHLHKLGKRVHIWTINDADTMHDLIDVGVDGIITDRPDTLKQVLLTRGMWYA